MTTTLSPAPTGQPATPPRSRRRVALAAAALVVAAGAGIGIGLAVSSGNSSSSTATSSYSYYQQTMGRYGSMMGGGMMGGGYSWMRGQEGYGWMMGGSSAPGWMTGGTLPGFMMGSSTDMGQVMGKLFADAPGPRVSASDAVKLGNQVPAGATIDRAANRIAFETTTVSFAVLAGPAGGPDETFRVAGLVNPTIVVPVGAKMSVQIINADPDTAHGLVVTASGGASSPMPMMSAAPAFSGAAVWFLGDPTSAGMHTATLSFTASAAGTYTYLCPVPGHAQKGMAGTFMVSS